MGTPYKMKGSPMQRNFGIGSPAKQTQEEKQEKIKTLDTFTPKRETSWWKGEEGFIPDELQPNVNRPKVSDKKVKAVNIGVSR
jgi:hypothetical protein